MLLYSAVFNPCSAHATFEMSISRAFIDFGFMEIGEFKEAKEEDDYQNEVTCTSDNGNTWYLKIHLVTPFRTETNQIPPGSFKWKVVDVINGTGYATRKNEFNDFSTAPMVVYTSSPEDNDMGREVTIRFVYGLEVPETQIAGDYTSLVRYTLTETL